MFDLRKLFNKRTSEEKKNQLESEVEENIRFNNRNAIMKEIDFAKRRKQSYVDLSEWLDPSITVELKNKGYEVKEFRDGYNYKTVIRW